MSTEPVIQDATRNGWNPSTPMSEEALDQVIEDSFPASDPPSHTPTTGLGAPQPTNHSPATRWRKRSVAIAGGIVLSVVAAVSGMAAWRRFARR